MRVLVPCEHPQGTYPSKVAPISFSLSLEIRGKRILLKMYQNYCKNFVFISKLKHIENHCFLGFVFSMVFVIVVVLVCS